MSIKINQVKKLLQCKSSKMADTCIGKSPEENMSLRIKKSAQKLFLKIIIFENNEILHSTLLHSE
ncbi:MAG: hypothetical protein ABFD79_04335 [Phycisphaerales bacterium]